MINAAGEKLPLWSLCRGKTSVCERNTKRELADEIRSGWLKIGHQKNGWCDKAIATQYLLWLREQVPIGDVALLWDVFSAHRDQEVKAYASELGIRLIFIPPGMTDVYQPLDKRIFGHLKQQAQAM
jgi:hypothetical protein